MYFPTRFLTAFLFAFGLAVPAPAQDGSEEIPFAGGTITIVETTDYEKIVSFNGEEIDRDFQVWFERIATVRGTEVALISIGPGGNACGANTLLLWSDGKDGVNTDKLPGDCGWPAPAVSDYAVFFVPWPGPGEELPVQRWAPDEGFALAGMLRFVPEPDTGWAGITADPAIHPLEYFSNAAFFADAAAALGDDLAEYALGLRVAAEMEKSMETSMRPPAAYRTIAVAPIRCLSSTSRPKPPGSPRSAAHKSRNGRPRINGPRQRAMR
jgi:hypothetical protein